MLLSLSSPMELRVLFFTYVSDQLDGLKEAANIEVCRYGCKTFMTFGNICIYNDG